MPNSALQENILVQTSDYKCKKQDNMLKRYLFKYKKEEDINNPLPYSIITKKFSSQYFKRNMNQQVSLTILNTEMMGINTTDIIYKLKHDTENLTDTKYPNWNYLRSRKKNTDHGVFDKKFTILEFWKMTNKFINIYEVTTDNELIKIDPLKYYQINGKKINSNITINGTNCITIEFYGSNSNSDYLIEIMNFISDYEQLSYSQFIKKFNNDYDDIITFTNNKLITPSNIDSKYNMIEVYHTIHGSILHYGEFEINKNILNLYFDGVFISNNLIFPYSSTNNNVIYRNQYISTISNYSEYIPNIFNIYNYDRFSSKIPEKINDNIKFGEYYLDENDQLLIYSSDDIVLKKADYIKLDNNDIFLDYNTNEIWRYKNNNWFREIDISKDDLFLDMRDLRLFSVLSKNNINILESSIDYIENINNDIYLNIDNALFFTYESSLSWNKYDPENDTYYVNSNNKKTLYHFIDSNIEHISCLTSIFYTNQKKIYKYSESDDTMLEYEYNKCTTNKYFIRKDNMNFWIFKDNECKLMDIITVDDINNVDNPLIGSYYYSSHDSSLYIYNNDWKKIQYYAINENIAFIDRFNNYSYWYYDFETDIWNEIILSDEDYNIYIDNDIIFEFNGTKWTQYDVKEISDGDFYYNENNLIYYKYISESWIKIENIKNVNLLESEYYYDDKLNIMWLYDKYESFNIFTSEKYHINKSMDIVWYYDYEIDMWKTKNIINIDILNFDEIYYDEINKIIWKYDSKYNVDVLIIGDRNIAFKGEYLALYDEIMAICNYNIEYVKSILEETLNTENDFSKLLLKYPYFYKENLEKIVKNDLYIKTMYYIKNTQIKYIDNNIYVLFKFPIKSFSFILFLNGKILEPDIYEEDDLDMNIYVIASKLVSNDELNRLFDNDVDYSHSSMSNFKHYQLNKNTHDYYSENKFYYHNPLDLELLSPITIVRSKSFYNENNRYPLISTPIYLDKKKYTRYDFDVDTNSFKSNINGRYLYYNNRYYMISNYEYNYNEEKNIFELSINKDGNFYKIITNRFKIPYNKKMDNLHNLTFVKEYNSDIGKLLEGIYFDKINANSKYPKYFIPNNNKYNKIINSHCNGNIVFDNGISSTMMSDTTIDCGDTNDLKYSYYDDLIRISYFSFKDKLSKYLLDSIINILIDKDYVYFITNIDYIVTNSSNISCKNICYNIENQSYLISDNIPKKDNYDYIRYNLYDEENNIILNKTDDRMIIDSQTISNDYEIIIHRALNNITSNIEYDNIAIVYDSIYFFMNKDCKYDNDIISLNGSYVYNILDNKLYEYKNEIVIDGGYSEIEYLYKNIYDESNNIIFRRKGYPRLYNEMDDVTLYNSDIGYSKIYSSDPVNDIKKFDIPNQLIYNYDQIMLFGNGYINHNHNIGKQVNLYNYEKIKDNDIFITNMPKLLLYQTIENMTLYSNMTIELSDSINDEVVNNLNYYKQYRKNIDIIHVPLSLKYMLIFVNGIYMDENHIDIISNRRFMLKNLKDFTEFETKKMKELYPDSDDNNNEIGYIINNIDIYVYPFSIYTEYLDYYYDKIPYYENGIFKYYEYRLSDKLYDKYLSEFVSDSKTKSDYVIFDNIKSDKVKEYYLSDFRHLALSKFTNIQLSMLKYNKISSDNYMSSYTHNELSNKTHDELTYYTYGIMKEE